MTTALIQDRDLSRAFIRERQRKGLDLYDEVWDGVYVMPPIANLAHQDLVQALGVVLADVVTGEGRGRVQPGANVSDRRTNWKKNYRIPDRVVVLNGGRAVDCDSHWFGGPDFLVEIESPDEDVEEKIPFYAKIGVRELLVVHRDSRRLRLYRHTGRALELAAESDSDARPWLASAVVALAFRWKSGRPGPATEVKRTDGKKKTWTV